MRSSDIRVGIVGCGNISGIYFQNLCGKRWPGIRITACADRVKARAEAKAAEYPGVRVLSTAALLRDPEVDVVLNLTIPKGHFPVSLMAVKAGKHVYSEKPITQTTTQVRKLLAEARRKGVYVGNAPDTFLGAGIQTSIKAIKDGLIGRPVGAVAFMLCSGHESWHPDPEFYYKKGGGPMYDMGPYYLTALVSMLGPVKSVCGSARMTSPYRTITSQPKSGTKVKVDVPTHVTGILEFTGGAVATIITSFDVKSPSLPCIEVFGTKGSINVPDPNCFGGEIKVKTDGDYKNMPYAHGIYENARGIGVLEMMKAAKSGRKSFRANGILAAHVLDIMESLHVSAKSGKRVILKAVDASKGMPAPFTPDKSMPLDKKTKK